METKQQVDWPKQWEKSPVHELDMMHKSFGLSFPCRGGHIAKVMWPKQGAAPPSEECAAEEAILT